MDLILMNETFQERCKVKINNYKNKIMNTRNLIKIIYNKKNYFCKCN